MATTISCDRCGALWVSKYPVLKVTLVTRDPWLRDASANVVGASGIDACQPCIDAIVAFMKTPLDGQ